MNGTLKWLLVTLSIVVAAIVGGSALGIDWAIIQGSVFAFLELIGTLFILFAGGVAAIEVARYYRRLNDEAERTDPAALPTAEVKAMIHEAIAEAHRERAGRDSAEHGAAERASPAADDRLDIDLDTDAPSSLPHDAPPRRQRS